MRASPDLLTIKALSDQSQTHRQTIHYYLRRGVLPQPVRVSRTSALYPKSSIVLLHLVKIAQEKKRLSLEEIRDLFRNSGYKAHLIRERLQADDGSAAKDLTVEDVRLRLDPPPPKTWIEELVKRELVEPEANRKELLFTHSSAELIRGLWDGARMGIPLDTFQTINDRIRAEADRETAQFLSSLREIELKGDAYSRLARLFEVLEKFATLRWKASLNSLFIRRFERSFDRFLGQDRQIIFPSESFFSKLGLDKEIDRLRARLASTPGDLEAMKDLARAYQFRGDWVRLHDISREILSREPSYSSATAYLGHALRYLGKYAESIQVLEEGIQRTGNALLKVRLGQTLINQAAETGEAGQFLAALIRRAKLAAEALRESDSDAKLSRNVRGVLAVDSLMLSDPLGANSPSVEDLQALYVDLKSTTAQGLSTLGKISLARARLYATYALYVARQREGHPDTQKLLEQVLKADPDSLLARRAEQTRKKTPAVKPSVKKAPAYQWRPPRI
jgi:DNA-binding transcriptional MerR regulator